MVKSRVTRAQTEREGVLDSTNGRRPAMQPATFVPPPLSSAPLPPFKSAHLRNKGRPPYSRPVTTTGRPVNVRSRIPGVSSSSVGIFLCIVAINKLKLHSFGVQGFYFFYYYINPTQSNTENILKVGWSVRRGVKHPFHDLDYFYVCDVISFQVKVFYCIMSLCYQSFGKVFVFHVQHCSYCIGYRLTRLMNLRQKIILSVKNYLFYKFRVYI